MIIVRILQWFSYLFTGIIVLIIGFRFVVMRFEQRPSINEVTKTCLITGTSSGIGRALAGEMVKRGWKVIGIARREEKLKEVEYELGSSFIPYICDVSKREQVHQVSDQIKEQNLAPTLFFLNASSWDSSDKFQPMFNAHKQTFDTNYFGVIVWVDEWLNEVKTLGGGTFVVISSVNAIFGGNGFVGAGYGASKAAISSVFRSLRLRYYNDGIGFVDVLPGPVDTQGLKTNTKLPFTHKPEDEARYIIDDVFARKQHIEPSWYWSIVIRLLNWLPDRFQVK
jgi:3-hydroxy acid dehydrogenase / malonic semialdehyde reductase